MQGGVSFYPVAVPKWIEGHLRQIAASLNNDNAGTIFPLDVDQANRLRTASYSTVAGLKRAQSRRQEETAVYPLVELVRGVHVRRHLDDGGKVRFGEGTPRGEIFALVDELLDYTSKRKRNAPDADSYLAIFDQLRFCAREGCGRAFVSPKRTRRHCSKRCRRAVEAPKGRKRVAAHRKRKREATQALGLDASPGACRDGRLGSDRTVVQARVEKLVCDHHLTPGEASTIVAREIAAVEKMLAASRL